MPTISLMVTVVLLELHLENKNGGDLISTVTLVCLTNVVVVVRMRLVVHVF